MDALKRIETECIMIGYDRAVGQNPEPKTLFFGVLPPYQSILFGGQPGSTRFDPAIGV